MASGFEALYRAMTAIVRDDEAALGGATGAAHWQDLLYAAVTHKCTGYLLHGMLKAGLTQGSNTLLLRALKEHGSAALVQSYTITAQLEQIAGTLGDAGIDHAFLKTGALLFELRDDARWTPLFDIDILVREADADAAWSALRGSGYTCKYSAEEIAGYRRSHHHRAPLDPVADGKTVEVHVAFSASNESSIATNWESLTPYLQLYPGKAHTYRLDEDGRALHLLLHGTGLHRLYDAVRVAQMLRSDRLLYRRLRAMVEREERERTMLQATLAVAAQMAGIRAEQSPDVRACVRWMYFREEMPRWLRARSQVLDHWFAERSIRAALRGVFPPAFRIDGKPAPRLHHLAGAAARGVAAAITVGYLIGWKR